MTDKKVCANCCYYSKISTRQGKCGGHLVELLNTINGKKELKPLITLKYERCDKHLLRPTA